MKKKLKRLLVRLSAVITMLGMTGIAIYDNSRFTTVLAIFTIFGLLPLVLGKFDIDYIWPDKNKE